MTSSTDRALLEVLDAFFVRVRKADAETLKAALERAARSAEAEVRASYLHAARLLGDGISVEVVRAWLATRDADAAIEDLDWDAYDRAIHDGLVLALAAAYLVTMRTGAAVYGSADGTEAAMLTLVRAAALEWAEQRTAEAVKDITAGTREAIRATIARVLSEGMSVEDAAMELRAVVGLNEVQAAALEAERARLEAEGVLSALERRAAERAYAEELIAARAQAIAETESVAAATAGQMESWTLLDGLGLLENGLVMVWVAQEDACDECLSMDGEEIPIGGVFDGAGIFGAPPLHPNCRCELELRSPSMG